MKRLTASKAGLLSRCGYWLRDNVLWEDAPRGPGARIGSLVHKFIELVLMGSKPTAALAEASETLSSGMDESDKEEALAMCVSWMRWWQAGEGLAGVLKSCMAPMDQAAGSLYVEPMFAWDPHSGVRRYIGQRLERNYEETLQPSEVGGTGDVLVLQGDVLHVVDWKSCQPFAPVPDAIEQLLLLAVLSRGVFSRVTKVKIYSVGVDRQSVRIGTDMEVSIFDLSQMEDAVTLKLRAVPEAVPTPGAHCYDMFCPARRFCPATQQTMTQLAGEPEKPLLPVITSDEQALWTHAKLKVVKDQHDAIKDALNAYIASRGGRISKGNGRALARVEMPGRRSFNSGAAVELLRSKGATEEETSTLWSPGKPYVQLKEVKE